MEPREVEFKDCTGGGGGGGQTKIFIKAEFRDCTRGGILRLHQRRKPKIAPEAESKGRP